MKKSIELFGRNYPPDFHPRMFGETEECEECGGLGWVEVYRWVKVGERKWEKRRRLKECPNCKRVGV